jgi:hypothetical protein
MKRELYSDKTGETVEVSDTYSTEAGDPIPAGTKLLCNVASCEWVEDKEFTDSATGEVREVPASINIMLHVVEKGQHKDRVIKDNLKIFDEKETKAKNAEVKLMTYDRLCKGLIAKARAAGKNIVGDDLLLSRALNGGAVLATFDVWEMGSRSGNWVRAIEKPGKVIQEEDKKVMEKEEEYDDTEIPF